MKLNILFIKFFLVLILTGCNNFKRFEQKKFFCKANELNIDLIDVIETNNEIGCIRLRSTKDKVNDYNTISRRKIRYK